jgi:hyperosmotically inducible periplasmic protein
MKTLIVLIIGAVIGVAIYLNYRPASERESDRARISEGAGNMRETLNQKIDLDTDQIRDELEKSGRVVRKKAEEAGAAIADATADARVTAAIKAKYAVEPDLSALSISVNTTKGVVTLAGSAGSLEQVKKAMRLALETEGANEVISTLQVKK